MRDRYEGLRQKLEGAMSTCGGDVFDPDECAVLASFVPDRLTRVVGPRYIVPPADTFMDRVYALGWFEDDDGDALRWMVELTKAEADTLQYIDEVYPDRDGLQPIRFTRKGLVFALHDWCVLYEIIERCVLVCQPAELAFAERLLGLMGFDWAPKVDV
jgi:hypothetical protein